MSKPTLVVVTGATASGKTGLAIDLALQLGCDIISADSRQLYRDIPIGTAQPTAEQLAAVPHHLVGILPLDSYYSASMFEQDAMRLLPDIFKRSGGRAVVCGGSMMYVDALCNGIDELPTISPEIRQSVLDLYRQRGLDEVMTRLHELDPEYAGTVDRSNHKRVIHGLEICLEAGMPYSRLRTGMRQDRPFDIIRIAIDRCREDLFDRINRRVEMMMDLGLESEARAVYGKRELNALNTVGYKEMFAWFDGSMDKTTAVARIQKNTRVYAKKQLTWLKRPSVAETTMLNPDCALTEAMEIIGSVESI